MEQLLWNWWMWWTRKIGFAIQSNCTRLTTATPWTRCSASCVDWFWTSYGYSWSKCPTIVGTGCPTDQGFLHIEANQSIGTFLGDGVCDGTWEQQQQYERAGVASQTIIGCYVIRSTPSKTFVFIARLRAHFVVFMEKENSVSFMTAAESQRRVATLAIEKGLWLAIRVMLFLRTSVNLVCQSWSRKPTKPLRRRQLWVVEKTLRFLVAQHPVFLVQEALKPFFRLQSNLTISVWCVLSWFATDFVTASSLAVSPFYCIEFVFQNQTAPSSSSLMKALTDFEVSHSTKTAGYY